MISSLIRGHLKGSLNFKSGLINEACYIWQSEISDPGVISLF